jgi:hypothetical protein
MPLENAAFSRMTIYMQNACQLPFDGPGHHSVFDAIDATNLFTSSDQMVHFWCAARLQSRPAKNRYGAQEWQCKWGNIAPESTLKIGWPDAGECRASRC